MRAVNLLTPELRSAQKGSGPSRPSVMETSGGLGAFIVLGVLALCVAGVAGSVLANNVVKDRKASLATVSLKNEATVKRATQLKPYADFQTLAQERAATVQALASARFDWEQSLRDLSRAMPSNVSLSTLTGSVGGGDAAASGSGIRGAIGAPAIELAGCTRSQPAVATLMSRLRNVQGVTRVSLSKSEKSSAAVSSSSGGASTGPCGKGSPPSFEVVVFFEKATVGTALADATGEVADPATAGAAAPAADAAGKPADDTAAKPASTPATKGGSTP
jgi:Tfp pilus assembly protein PilN